MSDQIHEQTPDGQADIEDVVASLDRLDDLPVSEHVAVFEAAHERLRGALADARTESTGP